MNHDNTLDRILADEELRHKLFPVTQYRTYLAHAAVCPLPASVSQAISSYAKRTSRTGQFEYLHHGIEAESRNMAAELLGAGANEIAFIPSTSAGLSTVASGLSWRNGDTVVIADWDFPANTYPWLNLQRLGVRIKFIRRKPSGLVTVEDVANQIDERTRLVSLSTVHFSTGAPIALDKIGKFLQGRGILFCVDAIQSLGILPCSVKHVDFLAADAHKWLLGPQGIGLLFVRREHFERLHPTMVGWKTSASPQNLAAKQLVLADSACRYEPGSLNIVGLVGLHSSLSLIRRIGVAVIAKRLGALRFKLISGLQSKGYEVLGSSSPDVLTGITSFGHKRKDVASLFAELKERGIIVSLRDDWRGQKCIRVSPHFYNTDADIDYLLATI